MMVGASMTTWTSTLSRKAIMKRSAMVFVLGLLVMTLGNAQQSDGLEISLSSGIAMPSSPMSFADYWKMQYGGSVGVGVPLSPSITLVGAVEYFRFNLNSDGVRDRINTEYMRDIWLFNDVYLNPSAEPSSVTAVSANIRVAPVGISGWLAPHCIAGAGVMRFSLSEMSIPTTSLLSADGRNISMTAQRTIRGGEETEPFFQIGFGFDVRLSDAMNVFVEARYVHGISKGLGTAYIPVNAGVRYRL
jgi:hypothetical protein